MPKPSEKRQLPSRNALGAISDDGSRRVIHPTVARGRFLARRRLTAWTLILIYVALPWIPIGGYPAVFLDTQAMRFHLFGLTFASQDLWLAFFLVSGLGFGLFYLTALIGRVWCGWACPQTVFLEHVYRAVEGWIEGDAVKRRQLDSAAWGPNKVVRRTVKHLLFILLSLALTHVFLSYFVSIEGLWAMMRQDPAEHWAAFLFVFVAAAALYFNFAWFREQLCVVICPYGRLQSALVDEHSLVIGYDERRGEPRGKVSIPDAGACIDCLRCVQVCPTGIDIRQGLQMECIACAACVDACDEVMDRLKRPRGLIRYDSQEGLAGRKTRWVRPRLLLYTALLLLGMGALTLALSGLGAATMTAWRSSGSAYYLDQGSVRNQFMVRVTNKRSETSLYRLDLDSDLGGAEARGIDQPFSIAGNGEIVKPVIVVVPNASFNGKFSMTVRLVDASGQTLVSRPLEFLGPDADFVR